MQGTGEQAQAFATTKTIGLIEIRSAQGKAEQGGDEQAFFFNAFFDIVFEIFGEGRHREQKNGFDLVNVGRKIFDGFELGFALLHGG